MTIPLESGIFLYKNLQVKHVKRNLPCWYCHESGIDVPDHWEGKSSAFQISAEQEEYGWFPMRYGVQPKMALF